MRDKFEKLGTVFLMVFATVLAAVLAADGMERLQWFGAAIAVMGSMGLAMIVRAWPQPQPVKVERD